MPNFERSTHSFRLGRAQRPSVSASDGPNPSTPVLAVNRSDGFWGDAADDKPSLGWIMAIRSIHQIVYVRDNEVDNWRTQGHVFWDRERIESKGLA